MPCIDFARRVATGRAGCRGGSGSVRPGPAQVPNLSFFQQGLLKRPTGSAFAWVRSDSLVKASKPQCFASCDRRRKYAYKLTLQPSDPRLVSREILRCQGLGTFRVSATDCETIGRLRRDTHGVIATRCLRSTYRATRSQVLPAKVFLMPRTKHRLRSSGRIRDLRHWNRIND